MRLDQGKDATFTFATPTSCSLFPLISINRKPKLMKLSREPALWTALRACSRCATSFAVSRGRKQRTITNTIPMKMRPEISGTVGSVEKPNVGGIEEVKCLGDDLQLLRFANREGSRKAQVYRTEIVASESICRLDAHTVVVAKTFAVHVGAGKFGESLWRLNRWCQAQSPAPPWTT